MSRRLFRNTAITTMAATATVAAVAPAVSAEEISFPDVTQDNVHYDNIMALAQQGVIEGNLEGDFEPFKEVKRGQVAAILADALNLEPVDVEKTLEQYNDVKVGDDHDKAIAAVTEEGIFGGDQDGNFNSWSDINREQMAKVLVEAFNLDQYERDDVDLNTDVISSEFTSYVQTLANLGITDQTNDYDSWTYVNRDTFSSFVVRSQEVKAENQAPTVENVSAVNDTTLSVTLEGADEAVEVEIDEALENGENEVTFTIDGNEYTETVSYDSEAPTITVDGEETVSVENGAELTLPDVSATDNVDEEIEVTSEITDSEGNVLDQIDTTEAGTYEVIYSSEDAAGNVAEEFVTVEVAEALTIEKFDNLNVFTDASLDSLALPETVDVTYGDNTTETKAVKWDTSDLELSTPGEYVLHGNVSSVLEDAVIKIIVEKEYPEQVELNHETYTMKTDETLQLEASLTPENAVKDGLTWSSNDETVVEVDNQGTVTPNKEGNATITVETKNGLTASVSIEVNNRPDLTTNAYGSVVINDVLRGVNINVTNRDNSEVIMEKVEVYEQGDLATTYTREDLNNSDIPTKIPGRQNWGMSISYKNGIWQEGSYVKLYVNSNGKTYEYKDSLEKE